MTKPNTRNKTVRRLLAILLISVLLLAVVLVLSLPYMKEKPLDEDPDHIPRPTENIPEPTEPRVEVHIPEPEKNPYGRNDFQFDGRYLESLRCDSIPGVEISRVFLVWRNSFFTNVFIFAPPHERNWMSFFKKTR